MGAVLPWFRIRFSEYKLIAGSGGEFEIRGGGKLLCAKLETGRFPEPGEILKQLESRLA